ncbi:MAG: DMT family transporter [Candidatus Glassbacteria bacterium]
MDTRTFKSNLLLILAAIIWGFSFVAQRAGMEYVGPFTFNAVRFALGGIGLIPFLWLNRSRRINSGENHPAPMPKTFRFGSLLVGLILFTGSSFQQIGIVYTTAGKAGFITGLYVIMVPILGLFLGQQSDTRIWLGAALATAGLYLLSITETLTISLGDLLVLISALFWAGHVLVIGWLSSRTDPIELAFFQFLACSLLSFIAALLVETITLWGIQKAIIAIFYAGFFSVGIGFTLQVIAQRHAHPAHAAIILSLETVFAAFGGWLILNEVLSHRAIAGCALMLTGMIVSQLNLKQENAQTPRSGSP